MMWLRSLFDNPLSGLRKLFPYLLLILCSSVYFYPFMTVLLHGPDEGTLIVGAERVAEGQVPFRDFFEAMGPGTFYWLALFFKLFGATWVTTRISLFFTCLAITVLMYHLGRRLQTTFSSVPAAVLFGTLFGPLWPTISHHGDSTLFALLSFYVVLSALQKYSLRLFFVAGALAGATTWFLQPKGLFLYFSYLLTAVLLLGYKAIRPCLCLTAGYAAVTGSLLVTFWRANALDDLLYANIVWPLTRYHYANTVPYGLGAIEFYWRRWTEALVPLFSPAIGYSVGAVLLVPFFLLMALPVLLGVFCVLRPRVAFGPKTIPYWAAGVAIWLSEMHRKDTMHLSYASPILLTLFFHLYGQVAPKWRWGQSALRALAICCFFLAAVNVGVALSAQTEIVTQRGVVHTFKADPVLAFLNEHPGEDVFVYPYAPTSLFLSAARNPTRFSLLIYGMHTREQFQDAVQSLEERKVPYVIWDRGLDDNSVKWLQPSGWTFPREDQLIMEPYLSERYRIIREAGTVRILERTDRALALSPP